MLPMALLRMRERVAIQYELQLSLYSQSKLEQAERSLCNTQGVHMYQRSESCADLQLLGTLQRPGEPHLPP